MEECTFKPQVNTASRKILQRFHRRSRVRVAGGVGNRLHANQPRKRDASIVGHHLVTAQDIHSCRDGGGELEAQVPPELRIDSQRPNLPETSSLLSTRNQSRMCGNATTPPGEMVALKTTRSKSQSPRRRPVRRPQTIHPLSTPVPHATQNRFETCAKFLVNLLLAFTTESFDAAC